MGQCMIIFYAIFLEDFMVVLYTRQLFQAESNFSREYALFWGGNHFSTSFHKSELPEMREYLELAATQRQQR